jgi:hypothetical protein
VLFGGRLFGELPGQHELGLEHGVEGVDEAVQRRREVSMDRVLDPALDMGYGSTSVAFVPGPIQRLGGAPELDNEVATQIRRLGLAALLLPQPDQRRLVRAHYDPRVRAAEEVAAILFLRSANCDRFRWFEVH